MTFEKSSGYLDTVIGRALPLPEIQKKVEQLKPTKVGRLADKVRDEAHSISVAHLY
jgi:hypothetical protein